MSRRPRGIRLGGNSSFCLLKYGVLHGRPWGWLGLGRKRFSAHGVHGRGQIGFASFRHGMMMRVWYQCTPPESDAPFPFIRSEP